MELTQLEYFYETAKRQHITQTANALNISQPAISKAINRLENDLNVKLFERDGKNIRLSDAGVIAYRYTEKILHDIDDMKDNLSSFSKAESGKIVIGSCFPNSEPNWLLRAIRSFSLSHPGVNIVLSQFPSDYLPRLLKERRIDIAISTSRITDSELEWEEFFVEPMGVILSEDNPLAQKSVLSITDLQNERFYCNDHNSDVTNLTKKFCQLCGFKPNIVFEGHFPSLIGESVGSNLGISIISLRGYEHSKDHPNQKSYEKKILYRPLKESFCRRECGISFLKNRYLSPSIVHFLDEIAQAYSSSEEGSVSLSRNLYSDGVKHTCH